MKRDKDEVLLFINLLIPLIFVAVGPRITGTGIEYFIILTLGSLFGSTTATYLKSKFIYSEKRSLTHLAIVNAATIFIVCLVVTITWVFQ